MLLIYQFAFHIPVVKGWSECLQTWHWKANSTHTSRYRGASRCVKPNNWCRYTMHFWQLLN